MRGGEGRGSEHPLPALAPAHSVLAALPLRVGAMDAPIPYNKALEWLADRKLSPKARRNVIGAFRSFLGWVKLRGEIREVSTAPLGSATSLL